MVTNLNFSHHIIDKYFLCKQFDILSTITASRGLFMAAIYDYISIYNYEGKFKTQIFSGKDTVNNFVLALNDNFIFVHLEKISTMSMSGQLVNTIKSHGAVSVSVSRNGVIYHANLYKGVFQSIDNGFTWEHVFKPIELCRYVIKVENELLEHKNVFWIVESNLTNFFVRIYKINQDNMKRNNITWVNVNLPEKIKTETIKNNILLLYDGYQSIFLYGENEDEIHLFNVIGQYCKTLKHFNEREKIALDAQLKLVYIMKRNCELNVYKLIH